MEIESTLKRKTYVKLMISYALRSSFFYFVSIFVIVLVVLGLLNKSRSDFLLALPFIAMGLYYALWLLYQCFRKSYYFERRRYIFRDDDVFVESPTAEQVIKWEGFKGWGKLSGCYCLTYLSGMFIIPEGDIPADKIQDFENILREKIDKIVITERAGS